jgi:hypothetical protein
MLSEHWLMTAAHCTIGADTTAAQIWSAPGANGKALLSYLQAPSGFVPVQTFVHPSWGGGDNDAPYDIALVHILDYGLDLSSIGRAKIATGDATPGASGNPTSATIAGFGWGEDPNAVLTPPLGGTFADNCQTTGGTTRDTARVSTENVYTDSSTVIAGDTVHCGGDSGGPWLYAFSGTYLQLAVHHGYNWYFWHGERDQGALIAPARSWIESTMNANMPYLFESWSSDGSVAGHAYRSYFELDAHNSTISTGNKQWCLMPTGSPAWGAVVVLEPCSAAVPSQQWSFDALGEIRNVFYPGSCLDAQGGQSQNGSPMQLFACNGSASQRFGYDADLTIHLGLDFHQCVDVAGGNLSPGTVVDAWSCNGSGAQLWRMWQ